MASTGMCQFSHQMNVSHPLPAPKRSVNVAKEKTPAPKRHRISKPALVILNNWFDSHIEHAYPDKGAVEMLSRTCNITATRVRNGAPTDAEDAGSNLRHKVQHLQMPATEKAVVLMQREC